MNHKALVLYGMVGLSVVLCLAGCMDEGGTNENVDRRGLASNALVIAKAESVAMATSALRSIDEGDMVVARSTLKAHIETGVVVLKEMRTGQEGAQAAMIDESILEAEAYLNGHAETSATESAGAKD